MSDSVGATISFRPLAEAGEENLIRLANDPRVRRHMPLASEAFDAEACRGFLAAKQKLWHDDGYGPWAFFVGDAFAGWGGFQKEEGEPDLALVLAPAFWGWGRRIAKALIDKGFGEMGFLAVTALLPPSRSHVAALLRRGFVRDGEVVLGGETFLRFRLHAPAGAMQRPAPMAAGGSHG